MPDAPLSESVLADLHKLGGEAFVRQMLDVFLDYIPTRIAAAKAAQSRCDMDALSKAVHPAKSGANNVGALRLRDIAAALEKGARTATPAQVTALLLQLEEEFARARGQVIKWQSDHPAP